MKVELGEILGVIGAVEANADMILGVAEAGSNLIYKFAPVLGKILDSTGDYMKERTVKSFNFYLENGFSREEALMLVLNSRIALAEMMKEVKVAKK